MTLHDNQGTERILMHRIKSGVYMGVDSKAMNNGRGDWLGVTAYHTLYV